MSQHRDGRFANATAMREALEGALLGMSPTAPRPAASGAAPAQAGAAPSLDLGEAEPAQAGAPQALADSQTGLAAAAKGTGQDDAQLLSALDRLRDQAATGDEGGAQMLKAVATDAPRPEPEPEKAPAAAVAPKPVAPPAADQFAPPEAESDELILDVADTPEVHRPGRRESEEMPAQRRRTQPSVGVVRSGGGFGVAFKVIVVLVILAGGAVGYRYWDKGYLLSPPTATTVGIRLGVVPRDATILVNGEPAQAGSFKADVGEKYEFTFSAKGRMSARRDVLAEAGKSQTFDIHLPSLLARIDPLVTAEASGTPPDLDAVADGDTDRAVAKLVELRRCLDSLGEPLEKSRSQYRATARSKRKIDRKHIPKVLPLPEDVITACRLILRTAGDLDPPLPRIDEMAVAHMKVVDELFKLTDRLFRYYRDSEFGFDKFKLGRRNHKTLVETYAEAWKGYAALSSTVAEQLSHMHARELDTLGAREEESAHWHLRKLALDSQAWVAREIRGAPAKDRKASRVALLETYEKTAALAKQADSGMADIRGSKEYLGAAGMVVDLARGEKLSKAQRREAVDLFNESIERFNAMIL
jgi:hypothetical protein